MTVTEIMPFEELRRQIHQKNRRADIFKLLGVNKNDFDNPDISELIGDMHEKLRQSWWCIKRRPDQTDVYDDADCRYIADSLRDAVRLCPTARLDEKYREKLIIEEDIF